MQCNWITSKGSTCWYESTRDSKQCYFHEKVRDGFIDGYYEHLAIEDRDTEKKWVQVR